MCHLELGQVCSERSGGTVSLPGMGEGITPLHPGLRVPQTSLSSLPPCVILLCAFDHLLGLKILYAKRSRTGVMTPWLQGPCPLLAHHPLQFRLGGQTGVATVLSPRGHTTLSDCLRAHLPLRGDGPPQCLLAETPAQELCLWACEPLPYVLHACIFCSQSVAIPP